MKTFIVVLGFMIILGTTFLSLDYFILWASYSVIIEIRELMHVLTFIISFILSIILFGYIMDEFN